MSAGGFTIWLTGAGRAILARPLADGLESRGRRVAFVGDELAGGRASRGGQGEGGASEAGSAGVDDESFAGDVVVLTSSDSSGRESWERLRQAPRPFVKVEVRGGLQDVAGGESAASAGAQTAGEQSPTPEATIHADANTPEQSVAHILSELETLSLIAAPGRRGEVYDDDEEEIIRRRLESMGYL